MNLTHINFEIPECEKIGISLSAGLDSLLLLILIIEELKRTNRLNTVEIIALTTEKKSGETEYASRMVNLINEKYNITINHRNNVPNSPEMEADGIADPQNIVDLYNEFNGKIRIYTGANNSNNSPYKLPFTYTQDECWYSPFLNLSKNQMIEMLYELSTEDLIPYAHSCSQQANGDCKNCYSCLERQWGFDQLGIENPECIPL